jgi:hypothetical protein
MPAETTLAVADNRNQVGGWLMVAPASMATVKQRAELERMAASTSLPHRHVVQARGLLWACEGMANDEIGRRCGVDSDAARRWRSRFASEGTEVWEGSTRTMAARVGIGKDSVAKIWAGHNLKPWKVDTFNTGTTTPSHSPAKPLPRASSPKFDGHDQRPTSSIHRRSARVR